MRSLDVDNCTEAGGQTCGLVNVGKKRNPVGVSGNLLKNHVGHISILWQNIQIAGKIWREKSTSKTKHFKAPNQIKTNFERIENV